MKRMFRVMLGLALLPIIATVPLFAQTVVPIFETSSNPLIIYVASDLSAQVSYKEQDMQVHPPTQELADSGFFILFPDFGNVYGPDFGSHPGGTSVTVPPTPWTPVSQEGTPDGDGSSGNPWTLTTTVNSAGGEVKVEQKVTYVDGDKDAEWEWIVTNISGGSLNCQFTHAAAMYMQGDGNAYGYHDPATGAVGGYNQARTWYEQLTPVIPALSAYEVNDYGTIWSHIIGDPAGTGFGLQNLVTPDYTKIAAGLQWDVNPFASGGQIIIKDKWRFGPNPPYPPSPTPTPPPVPPATQGLVITLNSTTLTAGDQFTVDVTVQPINQSFDAWAVILGNGAIYSMVLNNPAQIRGGLHPLITGVKRLGSQFSGQLLDMQIPPGVTGSYQVIVALVPAGKQPSLGNTIPNFLDQKTVTVQ